MIIDLKNAGIRCEQYMIQYGVIMGWKITGHSLLLKGQYRGDKIERNLYYSEAKEDNLGKIMLEIEESALAGLSN